jgi:phosphoribosylamine--glycine ligase
VRDVDEALQARIGTEVFIPLLHGLQRRGIPFRGVLYAGLMLTHAGPSVLEWNARFGDPETQVVVPRFQGDLLVALHAAATGELGRVAQPRMGPPTVCVVAAAAGYPAKPRTGDVITGLEEAGAEPDTVVFQAGTARRDGALVTNGGRVLSVMAQADTGAAARSRAYAAMDRITFAGKTVRKDIAASM